MSSTNFRAAYLLYTEIKHSHWLKMVLRTANQSALFQCRVAIICSLNRLLASFANFRPFLNTVTNRLEHLTIKA